MTPTSPDLLDTDTVAHAAASNGTDMARSTRLLDFRSGGWALLLAAALTLAIVLWQFAGVRRGGPVATIRGDGRDPATYGFNLSTCLVPREQIVAAGFPRDGLQALSSPTHWTTAEADAYTAELKKAHSGKFLVRGDRVIGVSIAGESRCYPLNVLNWHEVVNDTVGGVPILVTYNPLCDAAVVFDRTVGGEVREFGVSGLLYNSNLLLYDRTAPAGGESLWSQLQFRAIAGPAAERGETLRVLPAQVLHWSTWREQQPDTRVLAPDKARRKLYKRTYESYFGDDRLHFPVRPLPAESERPLKSRVVALQIGSDWHVLAYDTLRACGPTVSIAGRTFDLVFERSPETVQLLAHDDSLPPPLVHAFWFAWHAQHAAVGLGRCTGGPGAP